MQGIVVRIQNVSHKLIFQNQFPQQLALFAESAEPFTGEALLVEEDQQGQTAEGYGETDKGYTQALVLAMPFSACSVCNVTVSLLHTLFSPLGLVPPYWPRKGRSDLHHRV